MKLYTEKRRTEEDAVRTQNLISSHHSVLVLFVSHSGSKVTGVNVPSPVIQVSVRGFVQNGTLRGYSQCPTRHCCRGYSISMPYQTLLSWLLRLNALPDTVVAA